MCTGEIDSEKLVPVTLSSCPERIHWKYFGTLWNKLEKLQRRSKNPRWSKDEKMKYAHFTALLKWDENEKHFGRIKLKTFFKNLYKTFLSHIYVFFLYHFYFYFLWWHVVTVLWPLACPCVCCNVLSSEVNRVRAVLGARAKHWKHLDESLQCLNYNLLLWFAFYMGCWLDDTHSHVNDCRSSSASCGSRWSLVNFRSPDRKKKKKLPQLDKATIEFLSLSLEKALESMKCFEEANINLPAWNPCCRTHFLQAIKGTVTNIALTS